MWDVQLGHLKPITAPAPGNHEYGTEGAQGYFDYFGAIANGPRGYYSFDLGAWHIVSLNSDICGDDPGCGPGTPQYEWLQADLRRSSDSACTLAFQHHPRYDWRPYQTWVDDDGTTQYGGTETEPYVEMFDPDGDGSRRRRRAARRTQPHLPPMGAAGRRGQPATLCTRRATTSGGVSVPGDPVFRDARSGVASLTVGRPPRTCVRM